MGVDTKAFTFVGKEFRNGQEGIEYFRSKIELTQADLDEMGPKLEYLLQARKNKDYPDAGLYSIWSGDENCGYYIGYNVYDSNPIKMIEKINQACEKWKKLFNEEPKILQAVLFT